MNRLGPLATAAGLLIAGAFEAGPSGGAVLVSAGLIVLGSWLATEIWHQRKAADRHDDDGGDR